MVALSGRRWVRIPTSVILFRTLAIDIVIIIKSPFFIRLIFESQIFNGQQDKTQNPLFLSKNVERSLQQPIPLKKIPNYNSFSSLTTSNDNMIAQIITIHSQVNGKFATT
jgi:hypothetical protein